jgi:hypothetical protein
MVRNSAEDAVFLQAHHKDSKAKTQQATGLHKQVTFLHKNLALLTPFMCAL